MNRRRFLKILGLTVPAAMVLPERPERVETGRGTWHPGMPMSGGRVDRLNIEEWHYVSFDDHISGWKVPEGY